MGFPSPTLKARVSRKQAASPRHVTLEPRDSSVSPPQAGPALVGCFLPEHASLRRTDTRTYWGQFLSLPLPRAGAPGAFLHYLPCRLGKAAGNKTHRRVGAPLCLGPHGLVHTEPPAVHHLTVRFSYPGTVSHGGFRSSKLVDLKFVGFQCVQFFTCKESGTSRLLTCQVRNWDLRFCQNS